MIEAIVGGSALPPTWVLRFGEILRWAEDHSSSAVATLKQAAREDLKVAAALLRRYSTDYYHRYGRHENAFLLSNMAALMQLAAEQPDLAIEYWLAALADPLRLSQNSRIRRVAAMLRRTLDDYDAPLDLWGAYYERLGTICTAYNEPDSARRCLDAAATAFYMYELVYSGCQTTPTAALHGALTQRLNIWHDTRFADANALSRLGDLADELDQRATDTPRDPNTGTWRAIAGNTRVMQLDTHLRLIHAKDGAHLYLSRASEFLNTFAAQVAGGGDYSQRKFSLNRSILLARMGHMQKARDMARDAFVGFQQRELYLSAVGDDYLRDYSILYEDDIQKYGLFRHREPLFTDRSEFERLVAWPAKFRRAASSFRGRQVPAEQCTVTPTQIVEQQDSLCPSGRPARYLVDCVLKSQRSAATGMLRDEVEVLLARETFDFVLDLDRGLLYREKERPIAVNQAGQPAIDAVMLIEHIFDSMNTLKYDRSALFGVSGQALRSRVARLKRWLNESCDGLGDTLVLPANKKGVAPVPRTWSGCRIRRA